MDVDMVFEGGGAKGLAFVGALRAIQRRGLTPRRLIGTSAGSITALLVAAGYDAEGCFKALNQRMPDGRSRFTTFLTAPQIDAHTDISNSLRYWINTELDNPAVPNLIEPFVDQMVNSLVTHNGFRHLISLLSWGGWYADAPLREYFYDVLQADGRNLGASTLLEFARQTGRDLSVVASDVSGKEMLVLNHRTAPHCPTVWAVRMSMGCPFVWPEVLWRAEWGAYRGRDLTGHRIVDGGLLSNFPIELLLSTDETIEQIMGRDSTMEQVIGLLLDDDVLVPGVEDTDRTDRTAPGLLERMDLLETMMLRVTGMAETVLAARDKSSINQYADRVCHLPAKGYGMLEFDMTDERMAPILRAGEAAAEAHLKAHFAPTPA